MTVEHLFKLKKDGKTVGYAHINDYGQLMFRFPNVETWLCEDKFWEIMIKKYGFGLCACSYHSFVTKDKNGKDVFEGDEIVGIVFMEDLPPYQVKGNVKYYKASFCIVSNCTYYQINDLLEFELIEDKDNDNT